MKHLLFIIPLILIGSISKAQTYWDVQFKGRPVKKSVEVSYDNSGVITDSIVSEFYNDGKLKRTSWKSLNRQGEEAIWYFGNTSFRYRNDTLHMKINSNMGNVDSYGTVMKNRGNIFPITIYNYPTEPQAIAGGEPLGKSFYTYDKDFRLLSTSYEMEVGSGKTSFSYKEGQLQQIDMVNKYGDDEFTNQIVFETIKDNKYGWVERKDVTNSKIIKRYIAEFSKDELQDPKYAAKIVEPEITLDDIMKAYKGDSYSYSSKNEITEDKVKLLLQAIEMFESDKQIIESTSYDPGFFYENVSKFYARSNQLDKTEEICKRALKHFGDRSHINEKMNTYLSYLYEEQGQYQKALEHYLALDGSSIGQYDEAGNYYGLRKLKLYSLAGNKAKAEKGIKEYTIPIDEQINRPDFNIQKVRYEAIVIMKNLTNILELNNNYDKAELYATLVKDYYAADELYGKQSEEHMQALEHLIRIKKAKSGK